MTTKINLLFYKNLLYCDFFFIKRDFYIKKKQTAIFLPRFKNYNFLDLWELLNSFKRFILLVKYNLLRCRNKIFLNISDSFNYQFLMLFFKQYPLKNRKEFFRISNVLHVFDLPIEYFCTRLFYCLLEVDEKQVLKNCKKIVNSDIYMVSLLHLFQNKYIQGCYNLNTDFTELKKMIFFVLFINKIFSQYSLFR